MWFDVGISVDSRLIELNEIEQFPSIAEPFISEHQQMHWNLLKKFFGWVSLDRKEISSNSEFCPHDME